MKIIRSIFCLLIYFINININAAQDSDKMSSYTTISSSKAQGNFFTKQLQFPSELYRLIKEFSGESNLHRYIRLFAIIQENGLSKYLATYEQILEKDKEGINIASYYYLNLYDINKKELISSFNMSDKHYLSSLISTKDKQFVGASNLDHRDNGCIFMFSLDNNSKINNYFAFNGGSPIAYNSKESELITHHFSIINIMMSYSLFQRKANQCEIAMGNRVCSHISGPEISDVAYDLNNNYIAIAGGNSGIEYGSSAAYINVLDLSKEIFDRISNQTHKILAMLRLEGYRCTQANRVIWSKDGKYLCASNQYENRHHERKAKIFVWDASDITKTSQITNQLPVIFEKELGCTDFALINNYLAYMDKQHIIITDLDNQYHDIRIKTDFTDKNLEIQVSPDQKYLAVKSGSEIKFWKDPMRIIAALRKKRLELVL